MKTRTVAIFLVLGMINTAYSAGPEINKTKLDDHIRARQIKDMKWGMFICWSYSTISGRAWTPTKKRDAGYFKATGCDTDQ